MSRDPIRILCVDDDPDLLDLTATFLERESDYLRVDTARSADEGLDYLETETVDCIVSDYEMPGKDGIEFLNSVRDIYPDLPFILYTGKGSEELASEAISAGVTDYLQKGRGSEQYDILANRIRNVVERRRAQCERMRSDRRFEAIFEDPHILACVIDLNGALQRVNQTALKYTEAEREDVLGELLWETPWWDEEMRPKVRSWVNRAVEGEYVEFEATHTGPDGDSAVVVGTIRPVTDSAGEVTALVASAREVTKQKQQEQELREKSQLLDNIFEQVPLHLYVKDEQARHVRVSQHYVNDVDMYPDAKGHVGKTDLDLFSTDLARDTYEDDMRVIETGEPVLDKEEYDPGREEWHITSKVPMYDEDGEVTGLVGATWKITKQKEYEEKLERQNERLDEFVSVISHDLRNPLNVATGRLELARQERDDDHLKAAAQALDRMETMIDDLLTLAREGEGVGELEPVDVGELVQDCWRNVETADATVRAEVTRTVQADHGRLAQLLENLIRNAVEHGGDEVTVTAGELDDGFYIEDDGPGIPEDKRQDVFDAGYSTAEDGTGFGLSIAKQIIDAHGWEVRVTTGSAGGARFDITGVDFAE